MELESLLLLQPGAHRGGLVDPDDQLLGKDRVIARNRMEVQDLGDGIVPFMGLEGLEWLRVDRHLAFFGVCWCRSTQIFRKEDKGLLS